MINNVIEFLGGAVLAFGLLAVVDDYLDLPVPALWAIIGGAGLGIAFIL